MDGVLKEMVSFTYFLEMNILIYVSDFGSSYNYSFTTDYYLSKEELDFVTGLSVYPNPVIDYCNIKASSNLIDSVSIYNLQDKKLNALIMISQKLI